MDTKPYKINYYNNVECKNVDWLWYIGAKKVKESDLIKAISNYLKTVPNLFFWKEHGGMYGTAGIPDLIVCYKGRFIYMQMDCRRQRQKRRKRSHYRKQKREKTAAMFKTRRNYVDA